MTLVSGNSSPGYLDREDKFLTLFTKVRDADLVKKRETWPSCYFFSVLELNLNEKKVVKLFTLILIF